MAAVAGDGNWTDIPASNNAAWDYGTLTLQTKFIRKAVDISCTSPVWSNMITVSINPLPVTSAIAGPAVICDGATNKVWQVTNTAGSTYTWTVPASINRTSPQGLYFIIADAVPGMALPGDEITVRETFTSTTGCVGPVVHFPVTVQPTIPGAVVAGPLAVCQGDAGVVYSVPDNAGSTYSWVVPAGATITSNPALHSITVTFTMAGSGPVSVVETSGTVCTTIHIGITLTINPLPTQFNLTAPAAYCTGDPGVTITLSGSTVGVNYQLFKNALADGAPLAGTGSPITWANKTAATYYAVATNATTACVVQMNGTVVPVINIVAGGTIGSDEAICENTTPSAFTNVAGGTGGGSITYQWQSSLDGITFTDISGATSANYGSGPLAADTWFRRTAFSTMGSNVCSAYSNTIKITVNNFVAGSIGTDQTICEGAMPGASTSVTPTGDGVFSYQWEISTDGISYSDIGGAISETYTPGALASDTWYKRKSISTLLGVSCTKETNAVRISVINFTPGSINSDQTICEGGMPAAFTSVAPSGDGAFTYQWESSSDGTTFALIGAATSSTYGAGALNADTWYRRIVTSTLNLTLCTKTTNIIKVTVNNFVTGSIGSDQTICDGTAPAAFTSVTPTGDGAITYQWQSSADGVSYSNIPGATNEIYAPAAIIADTWYQRVVISTLGGSICSLMTNAIKVTVINFTSGTISAAQTICDGDIPAPFTSVAATGDGTFTYQWESSADGITFAPIGAATSSTYSPGALTADTWYRREATSTIGLNTCTLMSNMIKVTVNNFVPGSIDTDQTICENTAPSALTSVTPTGDGSFSYRWFSSPDGASFSVISGATSETYGPGNLAADTWYRREVTSSLNGKTCTAITNVVKITVNNFIAGSILSDQTICEGAMPGAFTSVIPTGDGTFTYQWKSSTDGLSYSNISGATSETYTEGVLTADTWYKRAVTSTLGTSICTLETAAIRVTVINFSAGSIGLDQTVCEGATPAVFTSAAPSGDGAFTYQWQNSADGTTFTPIVGATLATYAAPSIMADTWYRREVTSTLNITACVKFTNIIKVTVNNFVTGSIGSDQTICEGGIPAAFTSVTPTGDGTLTYLWQSSFDGVSYSNITGATSETYAPAALTADTWYRRQVTSTLNGNSCTLLTNDIKVTVNNFTPGVIGASQTICENDTPVAFTSTVASGDGTITYQWMNSADGATFAPIGGATLATYAPGALIADTWYKRQAISTLGLNICTGESNTIKVTVNNFTQGSIGSDQTICENTTPAALTSVAPTGDGALTYRWFSSPDGASFAVIPGAISETYAPGILAADTWYRREVTSTLSGKACTAITNTIKITVNNFVAGSIGSDQSICEGAIPAAFTSVTPTGDGAIGYQWQNSSDGVAFSNIAGATSETYTAVALIADTWYRRTVTSTLGANVCSLQTNIVKVTVINFTAGAIGTDQTICDGTAPAAFTSVAPTGDGVFTFQWQNSPDGVTFANIGTATSSTYSPGALAADAWYKRIVTSTLNLTPCTKETNIIKVTVNNFVAGSVGSDQTICEGDVPAAFTSVIPTGDGSFSYQWQLSSDGVSYASISGATSATYNAAALNADTWFRRQVTSTLNTIPCVLYTSAVKVTVNNFIPGSIGAAQTICDGDIPAALTSVAPSGDGTFTYQWESSPDGTTFASIGGATLATYAPLALNADTWYKRQVTSTLGLNTCTQETNTIKITVINFLPGSVGNDQTICENTAPTALTSVSPSGDGTFTYRWFDSADGVTFNVIAGATSETYAPGSLAADTWYRREVTSTLNGKSCVANTNMVRITVNNFIAGSIGIDQTICDGGLPAALTSVIPTGDGTFTYQWMVSSDGVAFSSIGGATAETYAPAALTSDTWYKRQVTSTMGVNTCMKETNAVRVSVINFNPGTTGSDQTICDGTAPAPFTGTAPSGDGVFTFLWENSIDGVTYNPIGGATAATYTSPAINVDTWFRRTTTSTLNLVSCILQSPAIKVTVNNFVPGTIAIDQTICEGAMPGAFTSVAATGDGAITYQWQSSLDGASFSNITGATSETYAPPALTADTWYRRAVTSTLSGVACTLTGNVVKVTVNNLTPGSIGTAQTICDGDVPVAFTSVAATADGAITYQWMSSADGISYAAIGGATSDTYGAGPTTQDTWFKRVVTSTLSGVPCTDESNTIKVTVNNFIPGSIGTDQTICDGAAASTLSSVTPTGDGIFTYRWFSSSDGVTFNLIIGAINETYYPGTLIADTWYRREVTSTLAGKSCVANTNIVRVTVNNFTAGSIGSDQTICSGSIPAALTSFTPTADGAITYQWKSSTDGVNYLNIIGATSELYTPGALTADTWYIRSVTSTLNLVPCTKETNAVRITVNNVIGGTIISDQTICKGSDPVTFFSVVHGTGDGAVTWQWKSSPDNITFTDVAGATALNFDPPVLLADTWYKRVTTSLLNTVSCSAESNIVKVTVNAVTGGTITANQTICFGSVPAPFGSSDDGTGSGSVTWQWLSSANNVIFSTIPGATLTTYAPGALLSTTYYKRVIISIENGVLCQNESNVIQVTVNPLPVAVLTGGETICASQSSILNVTMSVGTGPYTLNIQNLGLVPGYVSGADITVTPLATTTYTLLSVTDANGCIVNSPSANLMGSATVTVRTPAFITTSPVNKTICEYGVTSFTVVAGGTNITYQWYEDQGSGFNALTDAGIYFGSTSATLNLFGTTRTMDGYKYHVVVTNCTTPVTSADATLTVNTVPEITNQPKDSTICSTQNATFSVIATGTAVTYQWEVKKGALPFANVVNDANFGGAAASTLTITNAPGTFNNYIFRVKVGGVCGAPFYSNFVVLRVNVPPTITVNPVSQPICDAAGTVYFRGNGSGMIDSLRWQVNTGSGWNDIHDNAIYSGTMSQQLAVMNAPVGYNGYQFRLALKAVCANAYTNPAILTVNSNPVVTFTPASIPACGGIAQVLTPIITSGSGTWTQHTWTGDIGPLNNYFIMNPTFKTLLAATYNLNYRVKDSNGCYGNGDLAVVVDSPDATFTQDQVSGCTPLTVNFTKDMTGYTSFTWDYGDLSPVNTAVASPTHIYTNVTPSTIKYYTVSLTVVSAGGCTSTKTSMVTVYPAINATFTADFTSVCSGSTITYTALPGANTYAWDYGDGVAASGSHVASHTYTNFTLIPVVDTVKLVTTSFYGCVDNKKLTVTIMPVPAVSFTAAPVSQVWSALGNPVTITNTTPGTWTYEWKFGDGTTSAVQNPPVHTYNGIGTYTIRLTATNGVCTDSTKHDVIVTPLAPIASFAHVDGGCEPLYITLDNTSQNLISGTTYFWDFGDGNYSTQKNPTYTYQSSGDYTIKLTVTGPGGTSTYSQLVVVSVSPKAFFEVTPTIVFVNDQNVRLVDESTNAVSWVWDFGDGDTSKLKDPFHKYMEEGVYDINLLVTSADGCTDQYILSPAVTVQPAGVIRFASVFTPFLDGPQEPQAGHIPSDQMDNFFFPPIKEKVLNYKLQIFNRLGVLIFVTTDIDHPWNGYYKGKLCPQGVYVWFVEGKYATGKVFKKVGDITLLH
jgi:PKD repeat protein